MASSSTSSGAVAVDGSGSGNGAAVSNVAQAAVLKPSVQLPDSTPIIQGPNFDDPQTLQSLMNAYATVGFQATALSKAVDIVNDMRSWRLSQEPIDPELDPDDEKNQPEYRAQKKATVFLGFTSNLISSGLREVILFLVKHKHVDALVTTAGGIEEDLIKCLGQTYLGDFHLQGAALREQGLNRIGNLIVPNDNYCKFEDWVLPILDKMREEQGDSVSNAWSPSTVIERLGREINDERSVLYWASKNNIPVFCPALTDGSLGDMLYFHSYKNPDLTIDLVRDIRRLNDLSVKAAKAGMIILGGGVCKHQIANAMLFRNGADWAVYINTGQEFDGSDSGARPDEAVSWGKIKADAKAVKVCADATLIFPLLVAATYGKSHWQTQPEHGQ
ncbi:Deoxyhypusine synthase [Tilletia horrida]|uniref:deoxyhypusine synthase n=1 Tax=Tilletia horrida TaxID=155126 RepID=A0AAN6GNF0_9BASI|nr:Deoxyhypusine synthase [Tilletia horrida]KAK0548747.1 Deoxyhypusine synthase [Tilletia horrida]KAK0563852.1 Deoxyhypusine synthase [Tilletia horrida]